MFDRAARGVAFAVGLAAAGCGGSGERSVARPTSSTGEHAGLASGAQIPLVALPPEAEREQVPGFEGASAWLNVDHALTKRELEGRVVVVDFWTSCCINCMHTLPVLARLEKTFAGEAVTVVGVHSPKFDEERDVSRLRDFVLDQSIAHPIAVDADARVWEAWNVKAWPTVLVLDARGRAVWGAAGEPDYAELASVVASALAEAKSTATVAKGELRGLRRERREATPLRYPGRVLARDGGGLAVADTGHHRVVVTRRDGSIEAVIGAGTPGLRDGARAAAQFQRPAGLAELGGALYVADTGNHALRKVDLKTFAVTTVAGTGELGATLEEAARPAKGTPLRSPWGLLAHEGQLFVALAGSHQIARFDPAAGALSLFAGTGREALEDGERLRASFAQPSDLATDGSELFVLDSETSSVRAIDLAKGGQGAVRTVVGKGLFTFGDVDGPRDAARLQHPIGLAYARGALFVADSYNSKLKRVDPRTGAVKSVLGGKERSIFDEPAGVAARGGELFVADTNHHRVVRLSVDARGELLRAEAPRALDLVAFAGLEPPRAALPPAKVTIRASDPVARLDALHVPSDGGAVRIAWRLPPGTAINEAAPFKLTWVEASGLAAMPAQQRARGKDVPAGFEVEFVPAAGQKSALARGVLEVVVCDSITHAICVPVRRTVEAKVVVDIAPSGGAPSGRPVATVALPSAQR